VGASGEVLIVDEAVAREALGVAVGVWARELSGHHLARVEALEGDDAHVGVTARQALDVRVEKDAVGVAMTARRPRWNTGCMDAVGAGGGGFAPRSVAVQLRRRTCA